MYVVFAVGFVGYKEAIESVVFMNRNRKIPSEITMGLQPAIV
jgi:hypothetical protein